MLSEGIRASLALVLWCVAGRGVGVGWGVEVGLWVAGCGVCLFSAPPTWLLVELAVGVVGVAWWAAAAG
jgi:hypothetical protein